ncbi:hypothetical protein ES705_21397 [subsurface metagenome]
MELENIKNKWKELDKMLEESVKLNEKLLKNTFTQKANGAVESFLNWAYFSLIEFTVLIIFMVMATYNSMDDWRFLVSGIFIISFLTYFIYVTIMDIKQLKKVDLFFQSIVANRQAILNCKKRGINGMKILLFSIPLVVPTFPIMGAKFIRGLNLFDFPVFLTIMAISMIVLSYILAIISYDVLVIRKYKVIENNLKELESFKEE